MIVSSVITIGNQDSNARLQEIFDKKIDFICLETGDQVLPALDEKKVDLVITAEKLPDMTAKKLIENIITVNPMIGCVVLSDMDPADFHETFEGLGVLMQFPTRPEQAHIDALIKHLDSIRNLSATTAQVKGSPVK